MPIQNDKEIFRAQEFRLVHILTIPRNVILKRGATDSIVFDKHYLNRIQGGVEVSVLKVHVCVPQLDVVVFDLHKRGNLVSIIQYDATHPNLKRLYEGPFTVPLHYINVPLQVKDPCINQ